MMRSAEIGVPSGTPASWNTRTSGRRSLSPCAMEWRYMVMDSSLVIGMMFPDLVLNLTSRRMLHDRIQNFSVGSQLDSLFLAAFMPVKMAW